MQREAIEGTDLKNDATKPTKSNGGARGASRSAAGFQDRSEEHTSNSSHVIVSRMPSSA